MSDAPLLGSPTSICTDRDGRFSVVFDWEKAPDILWLNAADDLMKRSGRESVKADADGITISFHPQDADDALDDLTVLLADADRSYTNELEQREAALRYVRDALQSRFGSGNDLPIREI
jgi:hypothetical protein